MNRVRTMVGTLSVLAVLAALAVSSLHADIPPRDLEKIRTAAPLDALAKPKKPRKVLVFSLANEYRHKSIPWGAQAFRILGEKSGAYAAVLSDDPAMFDQDNLAQFDAVLFNNNCGNPVKDPKRRKNLLEFVKSGRGFVGIHCAAHLDWPEYTEMLGGYSISHPWNSGSTVTVKLDDPAHPLVACFCRSSFLHTDEIFEFRDYSRDRLRVLLTEKRCQEPFCIDPVPARAGAHAAKRFLTPFFRDYLFRNTSFSYCWMSSSHAPPTGTSDFRQ
ncbi:MAG: ThuA domain-containing protein [Pirellulaceae bacterium]